MLGRYYFRAADFMAFGIFLDDGDLAMLPLERRQDIASGFFAVFIVFALLSLGVYRLYHVTSAAPIITRMTMKVDFQALQSFHAH